MDQLFEGLAATILGKVNGKEASEEKNMEEGDAGRG